VCIFGDSQFFIGGDYEHANSGTGFAQFLFFDFAVFVQFLIDFDSQEGKVFTDVSPKNSIVFSDSGGEDDCIDTLPWQL
jgi:hypothetical protein